TGPRLHRVDELRYLQHRLALGGALAHQELALLGLDVLAPRSLAPAVVQPARDQLGLAGTASPGGAFVRQFDPGAQAGVEHRLAGPRVELEALVARIDLDTHALERDVIAVAELPRVESHRSEEHTSELQSRFDLVCRL